MHDFVFVCCVPRHNTMCSWHSAAMMLSPKVLALSEKTCRHCSLFWVSFSVLSATFLVQHSMSIGVLQCNSHFFVKNTWNIRYSLTNINLLYLKIYKRHNLPLQKEKNAYLYFFEYFYFPFWKQRLCHLYILGKVDLYF